MIYEMMTPMASKSEDEYASEMPSHTEMMCEVFKSLGKVEAKLDMLLMLEKEDEKESDDGILTLPMGSSHAGAMLDSSYDSSTSTYDGLPKTGTYNGSMF